jgi:hypothetical protein
VVTTLAGSPLTSGSADGTGSSAGFNDPTGIAVDGSGNIYVADYGNDTVRLVTAAGAVTTLAGSAGQAGSADGTGAAASFNGPAGVGVDFSGNVYVADENNDTIRVINPSGYVTTVAGNAGDADSVDGLSGNARFDSPGDVTIDAAGVVYVADSLNSTIRRIIPGAGSAPFFTAQPASQTVNIGAAAVFSFGISGTAPFSYQWFFNGSPISGATGPTYPLASAQESDAGSYTVTVTDSQGSATSSAATLAVTLLPGYPDITAQPQGGSLSGGSLVLTVSVTGNGPFAYQWLLNGSPISGATAPSYTASVPGSYTVSVTNSVATTVSNAAIVGSANRLINVSTRSLVGTGSGITIAGFVVQGPPGENKQLLVRGIGPTLATFGVAGTLAAPTITLVNSSGTTIASNTAWGTNSNAAQIATVSAQVGAFALPSGSADSAMLVSVPAGQYTVELSGVGSTTGVGLVEVYETNTSDPELLDNISTRAQVGTGANLLIAGFVVMGSQPANVLVRGVGPALTGFGVSGALANPVLALYDSSSTLIASNSGWGNAPLAGSSAVGATFRQATAADMAAAGAFALTAGSDDSAMVLSLPPGAYTAEITGANSTTGVALAEVYQLP